MTLKTTVVSAVFTAAGTSNVSGAGAAEFVPTGRNIGRNPDNHTLAMNWAKLRTRDELLAHHAAKLFREGVATACVATDKLPAFRGISYPDAPTSNEMGPPSKVPSPNLNRYGLNETPGLYLCNTEEGVRREVKPKQNEIVYVQRFFLSSPAMRLADFTNLHDGEFLNDAFYFAELASPEPSAHAWNGRSGHRSFERRQGSAVEAR